jgi:hypothetical protein
VAAFTSVWMGIACLALATTMAVWRPAFTDFYIWLILWLGSPGTMCIAGLVLWSYRKDPHDEPGIAAQRIQCKVAIALAIAAAAIVYVLIIRSDKLPAGLL